MKFHVQTLSGQWIGGFTCRRDTYDESINDLRDTAAMWKQPLIATRLDGKRRGDTVRIEPKADDKTRTIRQLHTAFNVAARRAGGILPACDGPNCSVCRAIDEAEEAIK